MRDTVEVFIVVVFVMCFSFLCVIMGMGHQMEKDNAVVTRQFCQPLCGAEVASVSRKGADTEHVFVCSCTHTVEK